jgi:hypothetical protein
VFAAVISLSTFLVGSHKLQLKTQLLLVPFSFKPPTVYQAELLPSRYGFLEAQLSHLRSARMIVQPKQERKSNLFLKINVLLRADI